MQWFVSRSLLALLALLAIAGCGGGSSNKNTVAVVSLAPSSVSMVAGDVVQLAVSAANSSNSPVNTTFTFNSSNPNLVTISPSGNVCAGVWDSTFVVCNGKDTAGNPLTGTATVTASAGGVSSGPVTVSIHPKVTSIQVTGAPIASPNNCLSHGNTQQFTAKAFNGTTDVTSSIGSFSWTSSNGSVASVDSNGLATANNPGSAGIVASVGTVTSQSVPFNTCLPVRIVLHKTGDPAGQPTEFVTLTTTQTLTVQADMIDQNGAVTLGAPVTLLSNNPAVATVSGSTSGATLTGISPGGAGLIAVCAPPVCGSGDSSLSYSNLLSVTVSGTSPATTVYVATTSIPAPGTVPSIVPIDTSKSPPVAGTPIALPGAPTSMAFSGDGTKLYVDTSSGLVLVNPNTNTITALDADPVGVILAVSRDGTKVIISNVKFQLDVPSQRLFIFDSTANTLQTFILPGAVAAAFTGDGSKAYIAATFTDPVSQLPRSQVYVWSPFQTIRTLTNATGTPNSVATVAAGPLAFVANGSSVSAFNTCDNSLNSSVPTTSAPQLVATQKNFNGLAIVNQTGVDITSVNLPDATISQCPPPVSYSNQFFDFGLGVFTARQVLFSSDGEHVAVLPQGINQIGVAVPGGAGPVLIPIAASGTEAVSGDLTLDGNTLWAGVAGTNTVHEISLAGAGDTFQIQLNLNNTNAIPDIIAVRPK